MLHENNIPKIGLIIRRAMTAGWLGKNNMGRTVHNVTRILAEEFGAFSQCGFPASQTSSFPNRDQRVRAGFVFQFIDE